MKSDYRDATASNAAECPYDPVHILREAIRLTREYVGEPMLPAIEGWEWFDAIKATGGFEGFGACGCVLDPQVHGRTAAGRLRYCTLPAAHTGDHGPRGAERSVQ